MVSISIMLSIYAVLLVFLLHNLWKYVIKQKRYKTFHITFFYILSFTVIIFRVTFFSLVLQFLIQVNGKQLTPPVKIDDVDNFTTYFELILGM